MQGFGLIFTCPVLICMLAAMLKHLLITWLVTSILGLGMAFASDVHIEQPVSHTHQLFDSSAPVPDQDGGNSDYFHNCHDAIHLLGLNISHEFATPVAFNALNVRYSASFIPLPPNSLFRPPITL